MPLPDRPAEVVNSGCTIERVKGAELDTRWWHTRVWAEMKDHSRWTRMFSIRPDRSMVKSARDCDEFLKALNVASKKKGKN